MSKPYVSPHRVWTEDKRFSLTRTDDRIVLERAVVSDGVHHVVPVLAMTHRDFVDLFAGLCAGASSMPTHEFALLRLQAATLFAKGNG